MDPLKQVHIISEVFLSISLLFLFKISPPYLTYSKEQGKEKTGCLSRRLNRETQWLDFGSFCGLNSELFNDVSGDFAFHECRRCRWLCLFNSLISEVK